MNDLAGRCAKRAISVLDVNDISQTLNLLFHHFRAFVISSAHGRRQSCLFSVSCMSYSDSISVLVIQCVLFPYPEDVPGRPSVSSQILHILSTYYSIVDDTT